ncbi:MAG TPA: RNA-binding protein [Anaerolineae bacterium]|nr:RNA-binding protein [Anaerolineae bacterium]
MKLYVGNLTYSVNEDTLREVFAQYGAVESVNIITDRDTGRSKGFGFVEMPNESQAKAAIEALSGTELEGRTLKVSETRPQERRPSGGRRY